MTFLRQTSVGFGEAVCDVCGDRAEVTWHEMFSIASLPPRWVAVRGVKGNPGHACSPVCEAALLLGLPVPVPVVP